MRPSGTAASLPGDIACSDHGATYGIGSHPDGSITPRGVESGRRPRDRHNHGIGPSRRLIIRFSAGSFRFGAPLADALANDTALPLAGSRYLLLETAQLDRGAYLHTALFQLQTLGYRIILAHPERLRAWQEDLEDLRELLFRGCYLQVNAGSLRGSFGKTAQRTAERLLKLGWVTFLASDGHSPHRRPPVLSDAVETAARLVGPAAAQELVLGNPFRVLCDEHIEPVVPEVARGGRFAWIRRLRGLPQ